MKNLFCAIGIGLLPCPLFSQYFEAGLWGGVSNYQGDLAEVLFVPSETHLAYGAFGKYNFNEWFSMKLGYYDGFISGSDRNARQPWKQLRNLSFISQIQEVSLLGEVSLLKFNPLAREHLLAPYIFAGIGIFHFDPMAWYQGIWYELQPLGTEGQGTSYYPNRKRYPLTQWTVPLGLGFKGSFAKHWNIGIEMGWRKTFTDYLDDVSSTYVSKEILLADNGPISWQLSNRTDEVDGGVEVLKDDSKMRGDPTRKDWYIFSGIYLSRNFDFVWRSKGVARYGRCDIPKNLGCPSGK